MKPRRVMISIEVITDAPIKRLRDAKLTYSGYVFSVQQIQVNVVKVVSKNKPGGTVFKKTQSLTLADTNTTNK